jgi:hypothetical protein
MEINKLNMKQYIKSEVFWYLLSWLIILLGFITLNVFDIHEYVFYLPILYIAYFTIKLIIYAFIINPYRGWKNNWKP